MSDHTEDHLLRRSSLASSSSSHDGQDFNYGPNVKLLSAYPHTHFLHTVLRRITFPFQICFRTQNSRGYSISSHTPTSLTLLFKSLSWIFAFLVALSILRGILFPSYANPPPHYRLLNEAISSSSYEGRGNIKGESVFIAANIIQEDLIKGQWGLSLLELVHLLGPENVFVSIYENDSGPGTAAALEELKAKLPCDFSIVTNAHVSLDNYPKVYLPNGNARVKRLAYLSDLRNRLLWPLEHPESHIGAQINHTSTSFNRILFLNDVYFSPIDAIHLLFSTNEANYSIACAADFISSVMFYDTFVVRDNEGYGMGFMFFPWFTSQGLSRGDVLAESDAVRVRSCWGGMASYDATPFLTPDAMHSATSHYPSINGTTLQPLRFRHDPEVFWESAECCLINADFAHREPSATSRIFLNPYIRVAYTARSWYWLSTIRRFERSFAILQYVVSAIGYPEYNARRTERPGHPSTQRRWLYTDASLNGEELGRASLEHAEKIIAQPGGFCGQKRLFVMKPNLEETNKQGSRNWEQIAVP
ncbi:hypothetical protein BT63DRAFT_465923 [Microthyrium microscopicum]|uniref:Glycosyltransferase family 69 protein n=1 Tax=Microthyrium microscopicum TaxID=703497 RepID=A0A6A6TUF1_9PEZI|nr:hypothetical protein BT63DRAFT_465923 [Microthyrium microscopicum]